ncbi:MAG: DUF262 domain-containing protein [Armatimonadota bacterium]
MDKKTLTSLFAESIYHIPDYQRGYAWEEKQWKDFVQDIDALVDEKVRSHYTGTVVIYDAGREAKVLDYGTKRLRVVDVVDGQQRLVTSCLYLSVIIRALVNNGESAYEGSIAEFLYTGATCKIALNNNTSEIFYNLLKNGKLFATPHSPHGQRLIDALSWLQAHIDQQLAERNDGISYLRDLHYAITQNLHFTFYAIEEECEIGMTFELMNSRGKPLSALELLKNYLMHWIYRNEDDLSKRNGMTALVNMNWKDIYANLASCKGSENQCLRIAWTLYCNHSPKTWEGYNGFKADDYIPLRRFTEKKSKSDVCEFIIRFVDGLAEISHHYDVITCPTDKNTNSQDELQWLTKIHHTGNIANFLPLLVAARIRRESDLDAEADYIALLKALECYAYRVFLYNGRRSNTGISSFYRWGDEVFTRIQSLRNVIGSVYFLIRYYAPDESFASGNAKPANWYGARHRLRYTLFEYELYLLEIEGKKHPNLTWEQLNDSTIEHILPQTPDAKSHWKLMWSDEDIRSSLHDIANLVLTHDNNRYGNHEFERKKGRAGESPSYSDSNIQQERRISRFHDWTPKQFAKRRKELMAWINNRWKTEITQVAVPLDVDDDLDDDIIECATEPLAT